MSLILPTFETCVEPHLDQMVIIELSPEKKAKVDAFCLKAVNSFIKATGNKPQELASWVRMRHQISAEAALEQYLGLDFVDYETINAFHQYSTKPLMGKFRINYFEDRKMPIIYRQNSLAVIFMMSLTPKATAFVLCGAASKTRLNSFKSVEAVPLETSNRANKACYYGIGECQPFTDLNTLMQTFYS